MPIAVEENVAVNHAGSVLTAKPIPLPEEGRLMFTEDEGLNFVGGEITAYQFREEQKKDRETEEVEAESISYTVCQYYGIETSENSFGYVANWSKDKDLKVLRESLETINKTSSALITDIDRHFDAICKERGIDRTAEAVSEPASAEEPEQSAPVQREEALYLVDDTVYLHVQPTDGGYDYMIVDKTGRKLTPAALGINLDFTAECEGYARVDGNVYSHTATITPSSDVRDNGHIRNVTQYDNSDTVIVEGDIP